MRRSDTHARAVTASMLQSDPELREAADRLVEERPDLPAGSVLRCFFRSVRAALLAGLPPSEVVAEAERRTRELLARRPGEAEQAPRRARPGADGPQPPRPRRAP